MSMTASSTSRTPGSVTSDSAQPRSSAMTGHVDRLFGETRQGTEAGLDGAHQAVLQRIDARSLDHVGEEAAHDEGARRLGVDAARAQVGQLLVVEPAGGA